MAAAAAAAMERKKYPNRVEDYQLFEMIGQGVSAVVHRAQCIPLDEVVAVKILDFERHNSDLNNISREAQTMTLIDHPNVLKSHCSFVHDHDLWVVMPYMAGGSCLHIMKCNHPDGLEEAVIATILREALKGLEYLHHQGHIHRDVKAGNILIDARGGVKLGDFGVSAFLFESGDRQRTRKTIVGTPCWMAPEVLEGSRGYDFKADIWSFGITALELAHGHAPFSKYPPIKVLLMTLQNAPPGLDYERDKKFSRHFRQMIGLCLVKDPSKRPSAKKLLKHPFFKQARSNDYIARKLLEGLPLPTLGDRYQALKEKEEDMLAQKKVPDGKKEEISQNEYKRGISSWDFDIEDLKSQASLIPDGDDTVSGRSQESWTAFYEQDKLPEGQSYSRTCSLSRYSDTENDAALQNASQVVPTSPHEAKSSKQENQLHLNSDGVMPHVATNVPGGALNKASKSAAGLNSEDLDEKTKVSVVQQRGRFKVTSESADLDKTLFSLGLQKSDSLQVIYQLPVNGALSSPDSASNPSISLYPQLYSILQSNILQRDSILSLMKQLSTGDLVGNRLTDGPTIPLPITGKLSLEASHEREKELLQEVVDLECRLMAIQDELHKLKSRNAQVPPSS